MKSWKNVTLRQAQELIALDPKNYSESEYLAYEVDQLAILLDKDPYNIETTMSVKEIIEALTEWNFLSELPKEDITKKVDTFKKNGTRYGLMNFNEITLAQMVDIEEYVNLGLVQNIHKIMSVLYLPTKSWNPFTKKYTLKEYEPDPKREEIFLDMDMEFVYGNLLFFYLIVTTYIKHTRDSLVEESNQMLTKMMKMKTKQNQ
jgi:hypothetical protein